MWALAMKNAGLRLHDTMIWEKQSAAFPARKNGNRYSQVFEYMFIFSNGKPSHVNLICDKPNKYAGISHTKTKFRLGNDEVNGVGHFTVNQFSPRTNVWKQSTTDDKAKKFHPATFPLQLVKDHINTWSNPGDVILDPFSGSGTSVLAAVELGRRGYGIDISQDYVNKSKRYIAEKLKMAE